MPLDSLNEHIDLIVNQIKDRKCSEIIYPLARKNLEISAENHIKGLKIIQNILRKAIIGPATDIEEKIREKGKTVNIEDIIRKYWLYQVANCYNSVERLNFEFTNQIESMLPLEVYYWLDSVFKGTKVPINFVLEASSQFSAQSYNEKILDPLSVGLELGAGIKVPGTLSAIDVTDVLQGFKITDGYVIDYIRGEARNTILWPILIHEIFHIVDRERKLLDNILQSGQTFPIINDDPETNLRHTREIFVDILSAKYFGPMYLLALVNYYERLPYVQTLDHPEMTLRLRAIQEYLMKTNIQYTDIYDRCKTICVEKTSSKIKGILESNNFTKEKESNVIQIYEAVSQLFDDLKFPSFKAALKQYQYQTSDEHYEHCKDKENLFVNPAYTFKDIEDLIFERGVSLGLDPRIILNVANARSEKYSAEKHFEIITDSIVKWKINKEWNKTIEAPI
jgi:hypothetical protein